LQEAWTSLRLSGAYQYPTHVDCLENILVQLHLRKTVWFYPPERVADFSPDPYHKHWPSADPRRMAKAKAYRLEAHLNPGDAVYIPLMWLHGVEATDWSVSANVYLTTVVGDGQHDVWVTYVRKRKRPGWKRFELDQGREIC
ncbi:unnamed protein product, partial [Choristocarpus tenellus]